MNATYPPPRKYGKGPFGLSPQIFFIVTHLSITMTLAILGNVLLVFVIIRGNKVARRRLSPVQLLLLHTCTADFLFAFFSLGTEIRLLVAYPFFPGPDSLCRAVHYLQMLPLYASPFLLVAISADRYQAICRPLDNFRQSRYRRPNCLAAVAWVLALLFSLPQLFVWKIQPSPVGTNRTVLQCKTIYGTETAMVSLKTMYILGFNGLAWLLPSFLAAIFYYKVCKAVWSSHRPEKIVKCEEKNNMITQTYIDKLREDSCGYRRQNSEFDRKRTQTVRLTMTIIACNFFLWTPFCITNVIQAISPKWISSEAIIFFVIFGNLNSCVNPWIYILFNRKHVVRAFCGRPSKGCTTRSETEYLPQQHSSRANHSQHHCGANAAHSSSTTASGAAAAAGGGTAAGALLLRQRHHECANGGKPTTTRLYVAGDARESNAPAAAGVRGRGAGHQVQLTSRSCSSCSQLLIVGGSPTSSIGTEVDSCHSVASAPAAVASGCERASESTESDVIEEDDDVIYDDGDDPTVTTASIEGLILHGFPSPQLSPSIYV